MVRLGCAHERSLENSITTPVCTFTEARAACAFLQDSGKPACSKQWWERISIILWWSNREWGVFWHRNLSVADRVKWYDEVSVVWKPAAAMKDAKPKKWRSWEMGVFSGPLIILEIISTAVKNKNRNNDFKSGFKTCMYLCMYERCGLKLLVWLDSWGKLWWGCFPFPREHCYFQVCRVDLWVWILGRFVSQGLEL